MYFTSYCSARARHFSAASAYNVGVSNNFSTASESAFKKVPAETAIRRARKAESLGLTYREYQLEILERGRFLQKEDTERIAEIIARRSQR